MTAIDWFLVGFPALTGGFLICAQLPRLLKGCPISNAGSAYRSFHRRMTERMVSKGILRFPGACMVDTSRPWGIAESSAILLFLALAYPFRSFAAVAEAFALSLAIGTGIAWVTLRNAARQSMLSVRRDLPVACFLLSLLLESGMGASSAMKETSVSIPEGPLSRELCGLVRSRTLGVPRAEAIERSGLRVPLEDYRLFLNHIQQGERLGIGLSRSLRELSSKMLEAQEHRAETIAQEAAVKMLFPLVCFIFPAVFLIILSPVILGLWDRIAG